jgi:hypothetical protein
MVPNAGRSRALQLRIPVWIALATALLHGCAGDTDGGAGASGDPPTDSVIPLDPAGLTRATLVEDLRLDAERESFSVVRTLAVGPKGQIAVPLPQDGQVRVYDSLGARTGTFGREGQGPGEFVTIGSVGFVGDTLWVRDARIPRMTWFAPDGSLLRTSNQETLRLAPVDSGGAPLEMPTVFFHPEVVHADGSMLGAGRYWYTDRSRVSNEIVVAVSAAGDASRVFSPAPYEDPRWYIEVEGLGWPMPFAMAPRTSFSPDGRLVADMFAQATSASGGTLTLAVMTAQGDTVFVRGYPFAGEPVSGSARDSALATLMPEGTPREGPADVGRRRQEIARERMPAVHPPASEFRVGLDGSIWIDLRPTSEGNVTLVLDPRGVPIASVLVPGGVLIRQASRDHVWAIHRDALGLTSVVRYRVEGLP